MPNAFKDLVLRTSGGRDIAADITDADWFGLWSIGAHGEYRGTVAELAVSLPGTVDAIAVEPVAVPNPFAGSFWTRYTVPAGLFYAIHGIRRAGNNNTFGASVWSSSSGAAPICCALVWRFLPTTSSGTGSVSISVGGVTAFSSSFTAGTRFQGGVWWVPDSAFDGSAWPSIVVTVSGGCAWTWVDIPAGALVPGLLPAGWDPAPLPTRRGSQAQRGNLFDLDGEYIHQSPPPSAVPLIPLSCMEYVMPNGLLATSPSSWFQDQVIDADGLGMCPSLYAQYMPMPPQPQGLPTDWSLRLSSYPLPAGNGYYQTVGASGFPCLWIPDLGDFREALNMPFIDGPPVTASIPGVQWGGNMQSARGALTAAWGGGGAAAAPAIGTTRSRAQFLPGPGEITLIINAHANHTAGDSVTVVIYEWGTSTTLYSGTIAMTGASQAITLSIADPGLGVDGIWEVSATINYNMTLTLPTGDSIAGLELTPVYRPLPWNVPTADGVGVVPGGIRNGQLRTIRPRLKFLSVSAAPGATSATAVVPTPLTGHGYQWDGTTFARVAFSPDQGWYSASAAATAEPTTAYAFPFGDADFAPLGAKQSLAPAITGRPFRVVATGQLRCPDHPSYGDLTVSISRFSPSPQAIPSDGSWVKLALAQGAGWASFTAPADGDYVIEAAWHNAAGNPSDTNKMAPWFCWWAGDDADVLVGATLVSDWLERGSYTLYTDPASVTSAGVYAIGSVATGAWAGHDNQLVEAFREWPTDPWQYRFHPPIAGIRALVPSGGFSYVAFTGASWNGWWPTWKGTLLAGETVYFRFHGPRSAATLDHGGDIAASFHFVRLSLP